MYCEFVVVGQLLCRRRSDHFSGGLGTKSGWKLPHQLQAILSLARQLKPASSVWGLGVRV